MKTFGITLASFILFTFCGMAQKGEKAEIEKIIDAWHQAASDVDQTGYFNLIDDAGIYIGTDSTEIWTKPEFYDWSTPHFEKGKAWSFSANSRNIYITENKQMSWFDELVDYGNGTLRGSGVLIKRTEGWRIIHYVLSVPVPNDKFKEVMEVISTSAEIEEREE